MKISVLTLFPEMFSGPFSYSIIKKAQEKGIVEIEFVNIRNYGIGKHKVVDDTPYGGGVGMIMRVDVLDKAITDTIKKNPAYKKRKIILMSASGKKYSQEKAYELASFDHLIIICGHYEGVDERIRHFIDEEISIGDFILTGGEIPAMVIIDSVVRLLPGVLKEEAAANESFSKKNFGKILEYPQFTKPLVYKSYKVPDILLSGHHQKIKEWREKKALEKTKKYRPDLLKK